MVLRYDILIVGAGPAGSQVACLLAGAGARVALLEKARFPRYKPCGGGLTARARRLLEWDGLPGLVEDEVRRVVFTCRFRDPVAVESRRPIIYMLMRDRLDQALAERAAAAGAELVEGASVEEIREGPREVTVRAGEKNWRGTFLVGADGARGMTARQLGLPPRRAGVALEGEIKVPADQLGGWHGSVVLNHGSVPAGYDWLFPKADHLSVGTGTFHSRADRLKSHYYSCEAAFGLQVEERRSLRGHPIPLLPPGPGRWHTDHALLVGDAAGLADPFSGEGLYGALASARAAAAALLEALGGRDRGLASYTDALNRELVPELAAAERLASIVYARPGLIHWLVKHDRAILDRLVQVLQGDLSYRELLAWLLHRYAILKLVVRGKW